MIVEYDGVEYGHATDIAERLTASGIANAAALIRTWTHRGLLTPVTYVGRRPLYRVADVYAVELRTRKTATRRGAPPRACSVSAPM